MSLFWSDERQKILHIKAVDLLSRTFLGAGKDQGSINLRTAEASLPHHSNRVQIVFARQWHHFTMWQDMLRDDAFCLTGMNTRCDGKTCQRHEGLSEREGKISSPVSPYANNCSMTLMGRNNLVGRSTKGVNS